MERSWVEAQAAFAAAAGAFVELVGRVEDQWGRPGLGEWDVRSLVGHTSRALLTVETYLDRPAETVEVTSAACYYALTRTVVAAPEVAARGRVAGADLGEDPATAVAGIATRVIPLLQRCTGGEVIATIVGGMRLGDYLPTRTFELVVHSADLAAAIDTDFAVPAPAARQALHLVAELAADDSLAVPLLLAATGRRGLPEGYTVL